MPVNPTIQGISNPPELHEALQGAQYLSDDGLSTSAYLALALGKPLLLEGAPGVGKTEAAKALSSILGRRLIRLQCYEGIDAGAALYEWNYPRQMLAIRQAGDEVELRGTIGARLFQQGRPAEEYMPGDRMDFLLES